MLYVIANYRLTANDRNADAHANILALFLTVFCPWLYVNMYCARAPTSAHSLYSIDLVRGLTSAMNSTQTGLFTPESRTNTASIQDKDVIVSRPNLRFIVLVKLSLSVISYNFLWVKSYAVHRPIVMSTCFVKMIWSWINIIREGWFVKPSIDTYVHLYASVHYFLLVIHSSQAICLCLHLTSHPIKQ